MKQETASQEMIDLRLIISKIISKWPYFLASMAIFGMLAYFYLKTVNDVYKVSASILLDDSTQDLDKELMGEIPTMQKPIEVEDEMAIMKSYSLVEQTIKQLDFGISYFKKTVFKKEPVYKNSPFEIILDSTHAQLVGIPIHIEYLENNRFRIRAEGEDITLYDLQNGEMIRKLPSVKFEKELLIGDDYEDRYMSFKIRFHEDYVNAYSAASSYFFVVNTVDALAERYQAKLGVEQISNKSNTVEVSSTGPIIEMERQFLDKLLETYRKNEQMRRTESGRRVLALIDDELKDISDTLRNMEQQYERVRKNTTVDLQTTSTALSQKVIALETERSTSAAKTEYYRYLLDNINNSSDIVAPTTANVNDPQLVALMNQLNQLEIQQSQIYSTTKEGSPQREEISSQISRQKRLIKENVQQSFETSQMMLQNVRQQLGDAKGQLRKLPESETILGQISRTFNFNDERYSQLLAQRTKIDIALEADSVDKTVIDPARKKGLIYPNKILIFGVALILGLGLPMVLVVTSDFLNEKVVSQTDIEKNTNIPILGYIIRGRKGVDLITSKNAGTILPESFRSVRVNLEYLNSEASQKVIGVTSSIQEKERPSVRRILVL